MAENVNGLVRTHMCGELNVQNIGQEITIMGWVSKRRDHGGLIFVDLRDRTGIVQVVFDPVVQPLFSHAQKLRNEYVVAIIGKVVQRPEGTQNRLVPTGEIEVTALQMRLLNSAKTPPFYISDNVNVDETVRLKYRYLDLRRPEMQQNLILRHQTAQVVRKYLDKNGFLEIETPILTKSTPEGARDFLVPSRVNPGKFFALPQSPQLFKQILMVSGFDRYYQIVRCFRDEDLRADRQPEFTQIDIEMSFVDRSRVMELAENLVKEIFAEIKGIEFTEPFQVLTYQAAMCRYGSDKPDLRFGMEIEDITNTVSDSSFQVFKDTVINNGCVRGINIKGFGNATRKEIDELTDLAKTMKAKGLAWVAVHQDEIKSPIQKFMTEQEMSEIIKALNGQPGDLLIFVAGPEEMVAPCLGNIRLFLGKKFGLIDPKAFRFLWVVDFPMFEYDEEEKRHTAVHHPFTAPLDEDIELLQVNPSKMRAKAYDMVLNGTEIGGGSIRIHSREIQEKIFSFLGHSEEDARDKFGYLLDAFEYGTPPHGGIAFGFDRLIMIMAGRESIRDVIAFPKTQSATCLMSQAPTEVSDNQLKELSVKVMKAKPL